MSFLQAKLQNGNSRMPSNMSTNDKGQTFENADTFDTLAPPRATRPSRRSTKWKANSMVRHRKIEMNKYLMFTLSVYISCCPNDVYIIDPESTRDIFQVTMK